MEKFFVEFNEYEPKYIQISNNIKKLINEKRISGGEKLPTIRALAKFLAVNNDTIVSCYKRLVSDGYAVQKVGSGTYVKKRDMISFFKREYSREIKSMISSKDENIIDFTGESNREVIFPIDEFKEVINKVLDRDGAEALINQESLGYMKLRETINEAFWQRSLDIDDLLIVSGAQQGIDIASKAMLNINDNVIDEIVNKCEFYEFGARRIDKIISKDIENVIIDGVIRGDKDIYIDSIVKKNITS